MGLLSIGHLLHQPVYQSVFFLLMTALAVPFVRAKNTNAIWNTAGVLYIGFIFTNAVFLWFEDSIWTYFFTSLAFSLVYILVVGILVSLLARALKTTGSGESATIFVFVIYHPVILLLVMLLKWIIH